MSVYRLLQPEAFYAENLVRNLYVSTVLVYERAALQDTDIWDVTTYMYAVCYVIYIYIHVQLLQFHLKF